jgi:hypothetical protein
MDRWARDDTTAFDEIHTTKQGEGLFAVYRTPSFHDMARRIAAGRKKGVVTDVLNNA